MVGLFTFTSLVGENGKQACEYNRMRWIHIEWFEGGERKKNVRLETMSDRNDKNTTTRDGRM